jgi:hypothetical protein
MSGSENFLKRVGSANKLNGNAKSAETIFVLHATYRKKQPTTVGP